MPRDDSDPESWMPRRSRRASRIERRAAALASNPRLRAERRVTFQDDGDEVRPRAFSFVAAISRDVARLSRAQGPSPRDCAEAHANATGCSIWLACPSFARAHQQDDGNCSCGVIIC